MDCSIIAFEEIAAEESDDTDTCYGTKIIGKLGMFSAPCYEKGKQLFMLYNYIGWL